MSENDLSSVIKYIRDLTDITKLKYIGHSQGTMIMFNALASNEYIQNSISHFVGLAPIINLTNQQSSILSAGSSVYQPIYKMANLLEILDITMNQPERTLTEYICKICQSLCNLLIGNISDLDPTVLVKDYV